MELYLDSVDFKEIEEAFKFGTLTGLTTTPTFMHRQGIKDIDGAILRLAGMVPVLQVEALGDNADEIVKEAHRLLALGMDPKKTVFKIPVSNEGIKACKRLTDQGLMVNIHLVYNLQQAYMATIAGATYVCPLVGRLQDQGYNALALVEECVEMVERFGYPTKIMFSSVRTAEHVRNAIQIGVHTITVPWGIMKRLTENHFTELGTKQFVEHTRALTLRVADIMNGEKPAVQIGQSVSDALVTMTEAGFGAVAVLEGEAIKGIFTDGTLRRALKEDKGVLNKKLSDFSFNTPLSVEYGEVLQTAIDLFKKHQVDNLIVTEGGQFKGMLDVQDLIKMNLIG